MCVLGGGGGWGWGGGALKGGHRRPVFLCLLFFCEYKFSFAFLLFCFSIFACLFSFLVCLVTSPLGYGLSQRTAGRKILSTAHSLYASHSGQQAGRYCRQHIACMRLTADSRQEDTVEST